MPQHGSEYAIVMGNILRINMLQIGGDLSEIFLELKGGS